MKLKVHLVFDGNCEEALTFYKTALNGEIDFIFRKEEDKTNVVSEIDKNKISHMVIKTPHFELAGEDADNGTKVNIGNNNKLVLVFDGHDECKMVFDQFALNGEIRMPFEKTFFCDGMGEVIDKYGITWLIMVTDEDYSA